MVALDSFYPMTGVTEQLAQWQKFATYYVGDGVVAGALLNFATTQHAPPGMNVDVGTGRCFIQGVFGENGTTKTLTIAAADATNPRIDRVVLRLDQVALNIQLLVLTGTPAASPSAPALLRSAAGTDYSLYQVLVGTTVTSIVTANLTDERIFESARGIPNRGTLAAATTFLPYGPQPLTEGHLAVQVSGTTTIVNIATGQVPPLPYALLFLKFESPGCTVQASGGNLVLARNYVSGAAQYAALTLMWDGFQWVEVARSGEQAPANQYYGNPTGTAAAGTFASIVAADLPTLSTWTPGTVVQGGATLSMSGVIARQWQAGKFVYFNYKGIVGTAGTSGTAILVNLPAGLTLASAANNPCIGSFIYVRTGTIEYAGSVQVNGTTQIAFVSTANNGALGTLPAFATTNTDVLTFVCMAEIA